MTALKILQFFYGVLEWLQQVTKQHIVVLSAGLFAFGVIGIPTVLQVKKDYTDLINIILIIIWLVILSSSLILIMYLLYTVLGESRPGTTLGTLSAIVITWIILTPILSQATSTDVIIETPTPICISNCVTVTTLPPSRYSPSTTATPTYTLTDEPPIPTIITDTPTATEVPIPTATYTDIVTNTPTPIPPSPIPTSTPEGVLGRLSNSEVTLSGRAYCLEAPYYDSFPPPSWLPQNIYTLIAYNILLTLQSVRKSDDLLLVKGERFGITGSLIIDIEQQHLPTTSELVCMFVIPRGGLTNPVGGSLNSNDLNNLGTFDCTAYCPNG